MNKLITVLDFDARRPLVDRGPQAHSTSFGPGLSTTISSISSEPGCSLSTAAFIGDPPVVTPGVGGGAQQVRATDAAAHPGA